MFSLSMAPKTLFLYPLYPFLRPLSPPNFSTHLFIYNPKPLYITCHSTNSHQNKPHSQSTPTIEPGGSGAAAPTRGDIFLERQQALEASAKVMLETKKIKKKKRDKMSKGSGVDYSCYGCGAPLQTVENDAPGYVDADMYQLKKKHHQLRTVLCGRCQLLSHGHMITAVGGNGGYAGGKQFVTAEELREKLSHLRYEKALIVKLVDIVDFNGSFLARVRDLAGANPIILVVTKVDLLPKGTDFNCVGDWVVEATMKKKLNVISVHLTSSKSLVGIAGVVSEIQKEKKGRDVYILGSANVGKSAFINALLKMLSYKDPVAAMARRYKPIQSAVPGTTVGPIEINAFIGGKLYDTPGVHLHHRQAAVVHSEDLPLLAPRSRLRGQSLTVPANDMAPEVIISNGMNGYSIFWGGLVRIDVLKVLPETCLTFYGPKAVKTCIVPTCKADEFYKKEIGILLTPPTGKQIVDQWSGLETHRELQINFEDANRPACDVAISGLGWICVEPVGKGVGVSSELNLEETEVAKELHLRIHVPKPVEIFIRPPMPVGKAGGDWYQYPDLTEKEEEVRPKWFF
ncbi:putative nitric oxide synthase isoform X1 [Daucus carota subsp. sativus]|uniref:putative nitric oxide synthase isoform X1 n=1 Tax=Daucus carota subsp. sativus TaxID=79200 RepID=UPI0007EF90F6|nr:PREDICTED: putative nitric oxide synthase isoform X3 [Daucus carota subsp. sativus]